MNKPSQYLYVYVFVIVLTFASSCARKPDDARISSDIQNKFSQDSGLSTKQLTVQADNGTVTLAGIVDNDAQREAASRQAASVPGVKQIINNLQVGNEKPAAAVAAAPEPTETEVASPPPPRPVRAESHAPRKTHKARASEDPDAAANSANDSSSNNMSADNQPASNAAPPVPPANSAVQSAPPPPPPRKLIIDQGTQLSVRLIDAIDSEKNQAGDVIHATLNTPINSDGELALPTGTEVTGHLVDVKSAGKFKGQSAVVVQLDSLSLGGKTYNLQTDQYRKEGSSRGKNTAEKVGGGAIIGAIAGGGKGAAIGSAAGAGVGAGAQEISKSQQIKLPSETVLNFTLQAPITVVQTPNPNANRPRLGDSQ